MFNEDEDIDWVQTEKSVFEAASNHPFLVGLHSCFQVFTIIVFMTILHFFRQNHDFSSLLNLYQEEI